MREGNRILALLFEHLAPLIQPGITTVELDREAELFIRSSHAVPAFKGYRGYPATLCTSVNNEVIHGIPSTRRLLAGDIVSIDVGALHEGFYSDSARTFAVGDVSKNAHRLMDVTEKALYEGIGQSVAGNHLYYISAAIQKVVESAGFHVVREFVGHGIGRGAPRGAPGAQLRSARARAAAPRGAGGRGRADGQCRRPRSEDGRGRLDGTDAGRVAFGPFRVFDRGDRQRSASVRIRSRRLRAGSRR